MTCPIIILRHDFKIAALALLVCAWPEGSTMQRLCSSCLRGLKMGLAPSFPIEMEPVHFEPAEIFSSTGKRRVVDEEALQVVRCGESIEEDLYRDIVTRNHTPYDHIEQINFDQLTEKYPNWTRSNIAEFRLEFIKHDDDDDALLNYDEVSNVLDKLGDDSPTNIRFHCFVQTMKSKIGCPELGNKVDFHDFLDLCHLLCRVRVREGISSCEDIKLEASGAGRTDSAKASPLPEPRRSGRLLSPRTRRSANGSSSPQLSGSSADSPGCKPKPKTLCSCPLADISETETDSRILRGKSGRGKVKSQDHVDNILRNHCVTPAFNKTSALNKLGNTEATGIELADNTRYSVRTDHKVPNNRVTWQE